MAELLLASGSPRRATLIEQLGIRFRVFHPEIDEAIRAGEVPREYVRRMSIEKARASAGALGDSAALLCADTIVVIDGRILGKPVDRQDAFEMLDVLSGREHTVTTSVTIGNGQEEVTFEVETIVRFRQLNNIDIARYWATGEPRDKAGAYGIQGLGATFVESIDGSYSNVVGLPLMETAQALGRFGIDCLELAGACDTEKNGGKEL